MAEPATRRPLSRTEKIVASCFAASLAASIGLFVVYAVGGQPQVEGTLLFFTLGGIGAGIVVWAKRYLPHGPFSEPRGQIASSEEDVEAFRKDFEEGGVEIARRGFLTKLGGAALAALSLAAIFPIRSLGPRPGAGLKTTPWRKGLRLVTEQGQPVKVDAVGVDGILTVFPEGYVDAADAPALLIHLRPGENQPRPGREAFAVGDLVTYSKLCTHLGCPVGLYQAQAGLLLCPCHQSTFDVPNGCNPVFGPATRPLPQLPIAADADGYLIAQGDFSAPVGPGFWDRDRA